MNYMDVEKEAWESIVFDLQNAGIMVQMIDTPESYTKFNLEYSGMENQLPFPIQIFVDIAEKNGWRPLMRSWNQMDQYEFQGILDDQNVFILKLRELTLEFEFLP